jgi:hypothetical protein
MHYYTRSDLEKMLECPDVTEYAKRIFKEALKGSQDDFSWLGDKYAWTFPDNVIDPTNVPESQQVSDLSDLK